MDKIKTNYRGFEIYFREYDEAWECEVANSNYSRQKLSEVKKKVDDFLKSESEFKNLEAISLNRGFSLSSNLFGKTVLITSVTKEGDVWTKFNGRREKISKGSRYDYLAKVTDGNKSKLEDIAKLRREIDERLENIKVITGSIERVFQHDEEVG